MRAAWILAAGLIASGLALAADPDLFPLAAPEPMMVAIQPPHPELLLPANPR